MSTWRDSLLASRRSGLDSYAATLAACPTAVGLFACVQSIAIAPIKSLGMLPLTTAMVSGRGLRTGDGQFLDRACMLGRWVPDKSWNLERFSQREEPKLALVRVTYDGLNLAYDAPGMNTLVVSQEDIQPVNSIAHTIRMTSHGDVYQVAVCSNKITAWVRQFLQLHRSMDGYDSRDVVVLCHPQGFCRAVEDQHRCGQDAETMYTDGGQVLVASASTLEWMNSLFPTSADGKLSMAAFRPNIVLSGLPANMEDVVSTIRIGGTDYLLRFGGLCVRCKVTTVQPRTGVVRADMQPLPWLAKHRPSRPPKNEGTTFAVNCVLDCAANDRWLLRVGQGMEVIEEK